MYNEKKILALIPARGGSKGIKNKNIISLQGKPLIAYTIQAALESQFIDYVCVTTDSEQIAKVSRLFGASAPFLRPPELATDEAKTIDAVVHAINALERKNKYFDVLVLLQPTQPLRTTEDIDLAIIEFFKHNTKALASVSPVDDHPLLVRRIDEKGTLQPLLQRNSTCRRQDLPPFFRINGCIYINNTSEINLETSFNDNEQSFLMSKEHSIDIDELSDLALAEYYLQTKSQ